MFKPTNRHRQLFAGLNGLCAIALGAVGQHALTDPAAQALAERASLYQLVHAAVLLLPAVQANRYAWPVLALGILLFSGSLYAKALFGVAALLAPAGGIFLMLGWLLLAISGLRLIRP